MISFDAVDFSECCSEESDKFLLMLSVECYFKAPCQKIIVSDSPRLLGSV